MTELPKSWEWATLPEIAIVRGGIQKQQKRKPVENKYPFLRVANVLRGSLDLTNVHEIELFDGELERYVLQHGDLLVVEGNGSPNHIGRAAMWRDEVSNTVHQNHLICVRPSATVDSRFLEILWNSPLIIEQLKGLAGSTSGLLTLSVSKLERVRLPIPPAAEQRRIVEALEEHLSSLKKGKVQLVELLERLDRCRVGVLKALTSGSLGRTEHLTIADGPRPVGTVDDGQLQRIPGSWQWKRLGEIADVAGGVTKDTKKQSDSTLPEVPYLRVANVQRGRLDLSAISYIRVSPAKVKQLELQQGDILMNEGGDRDKLGRGWIWEGQIPGCIHQNHVFRARIRGELLHPKLLSWYANCSGSWFERNGKQSVNLASISLSRVKLLPIPIPPKDQQTAIVDTADEYLSMFGKAEEIIRATLPNVDTLYKSLLTVAFTGRLVAQDPTDEHSSSMLKRIKTELVALARPRRGRRPKMTSDSQALEFGPVHHPEPVSPGIQSALELEL